jgi:predicted transcriptional regulator YheO
MSLKNMDYNMDMDIIDIYFHKAKNTVGIHGISFFIKENYVPLKI